MRTLAVALIRAYRAFLSPVLPQSCRFVPTCSEYAMTAIRRFGVFQGGIMAVKRILKCHPFHEGGYDPVE